MTPAAVLRIVRKDARHFWPYLAIYWALCALSGVLPFHPANDSRGPIPLQDTVELLRWLALGVLTVVLIQDDGPDGRNASWLSRPMSLGDILGAKLVEGIGWVVAPVVVVTVWQGLALDLGGADIARGALEIAGFNAMICGLCGTLGAFTRGMVHAVGVALVTVIGCTTLGHLLDQRLRDAFERPSGFGVWMWPPDSNRSYQVMIVGFLIAAPILIWVLYRTRRSAAAAVATVAVLLAVHEGSYVYPIAVPMPWPAAGTPPVPLAKVALADPRLTVLMVGSDGVNGQERYSLGVRIRLDYPGGQPRALPLASQARFAVEGGPAFTMGDPIWTQTDRYGSGTSGGGQEPLPWVEFAAAVGGRVTNPPAGGVVMIANLLALPKAEAERFRGKSGHLDAWVEFGNYRMGLKGEAPLRPGAEIRNQQSLWRIRSMLLLPDGVATVGVDSFWFATRTPFGNAGGRFVLVNRVRNEVAMPRADWGQRGVHSYTAVQGATTTIPFGRVVGLKDRHEGGPITAEWLNEAHLAVLDYNGGANERVHVDLGTVEMPASL